MKNKIEATTKIVIDEATAIFPSRLSASDELLPVKLIMMLTVHLESI